MEYNMNRIKITILQSKIAIQKIFKITQGRGGRCEIQKFCISDSASIPIVFQKRRIIPFVWKMEQTI